MIYIRRKKSDTWHFHPECHHYPILGLSQPPDNSWEGWEEPADWDNLVMRKRKPTSGELCNECQAKSRKKITKKKARKAWRGGR